MLTVYTAEQRDGRMTISTDRDCLPADVIRTATKFFPRYEDVLAYAEMLWKRGFQVTIDTERGIVDYEH